MGCNYASVSSSSQSLNIFEHLLPASVILGTEAGRIACPTHSWKFLTYKTLVYQPLPHTVQSHGPIVTSRRHPRMTIQLSSTGEIASFHDVDQFQPAKTQFACGFFACAVVKAMAPVGQSSIQSVSQMIAEAEQWYTQYNGNDASNNLNGMTLQQLYGLVVQIGLHFQATSIDPHVLRAWLALGYPVIVAATVTGPSVLPT